MRYSEVDGVVGVSDRVELLVAVLNAEQNLGGVAFIRRRNLDGLETALKRTVFFDRSEEHTSELQSLRHLVCRLLLEKKNHQHAAHHGYGSLPGGSELRPHVRHA